MAKKLDEVFVATAPEALRASTRAFCQPSISSNRVMVAMSERITVNREQ